MKKVIPMLICTLLFLTACADHQDKTSTFAIEMELTEQYDDSEPFVDARLFYVTDNVDRLVLQVSFRQEAQSGSLEIADNRTKEVLWKNDWKGSVEQTTFSVPLHALQKEKEYVIQYTGTKVNYAKMTVQSTQNIIKERAKPIQAE